MTTTGEHITRGRSLAGVGGLRPAHLVWSLALLAGAICASTRIAAACDEVTDSAAVAEDAEAAVFVSPAEAFAAVAEGATLVDVRRRGAWRRAHAPGAVQADWDDFSDPDERGRLHPDDDFLEAQLEAIGVDDGRPVYMIGDWQQGWGEEGRVFWMLEYLGHNNAHIVLGGYDAWRDAGLPTTRDRAEVPAGHFTVRRNPALVVRFDQIDAENMHLVDTRDRAEFDGATPYGSSRGGHIDGATWFRWTDVFTSDGAVRDLSELSALTSHDGDLIVPYCTGGVRSGFVYAVLRHHGVTGVANYAGSWWEYARNIDEQDSQPAHRPRTPE